MEELKTGAGRGRWRGQAGPTGSRQAGRQQEARVEGQPRDNDGTLLEATATNEALMREERRRENRREQESRGGSFSSGGEPAVREDSVTHTHVNKSGLPDDAQLRYNVLTYRNLQIHNSQQICILPHLYLYSVLSSNIMSI